MEREVCGIGAKKPIPKDINRAISPDINPLVKDAIVATKADGVALVKKALINPFMDVSEHAR